MRVTLQRPTLNEDVDDNDDGDGNGYGYANNEKCFLGENITVPTMIVYECEWHANQETSEQKRASKSVNTARQRGFNLLSPRATVGVKIRVCSFYMIWRDNAQTPTNISKKHARTNTYSNVSQKRVALTVSHDRAE